jgi:hypothetical protein
MVRAILAAILVALAPSPSVDPHVTALAERIFAESQIGKLDLSLFAPRAQKMLASMGPMTRTVAKDLGRLGKPVNVTFVASRHLVTTAGR